MKTGVFVGLITLDCLYQTQKSLEPNEKQVAEAVLLVAGGPATNAAVTFQALGDRARLVGALGCHPLSTVVRDDLMYEGVEILDLSPEENSPPPFSTIVVNRLTGDRAVISRNATDRPLLTQLPSEDLLVGADCLLIDGHQMVVGRLLASQAQQAQIPIIVDAGSWKPGFESVLPLATVVIASSTFAPPRWGTGDRAIQYLQSLDVPYIAITQGADPVLYQTPTMAGKLSVPAIHSVDTLGAGDIFHGAFCQSFMHRYDFLQGLIDAIAVATWSCQFFGTRQWIPAWTEQSR